MRIKVLMITYNRPAYTRLSLCRLCDSLPDSARVTIWDNHSGTEMRSVLEPFRSHLRVEQVIYHTRNEKLRGPTNWFWENSKDADFLSKVDDDCLMPEGWCETLLAAHEDVPEAGVLGCWRFPEEDFNEGLASRKIQRFGKHRLMRNCWVEGSGYLMKRSVVDRIGLLRDGESFTTWCTRSAAMGFINGWYYPFLFQEHMDDPRAPNSGIRTEEDFRQLRPLSAHTFRVETREEWIKRLRHSAWTLQACSYDPSDFLGWRAALRRKLGRWIGRELLPRA